MTRTETIAFNNGVSAVLALALRSVQAMEPRLVEKPTRFNYAIGALHALADEGRALLLPLPPPLGEAADVDTPRPSPSPLCALTEGTGG